MIRAKQSTPDDIVITGIGILTAHGLGFDKNMAAFGESQPLTTADDYKIKGFNPAPFLSDRKVAKVVSHRDVLGLVAFEECIKNAGISSQTVDPNRTGLYVGAPPSSCGDHVNYEEGISAATDSTGILSERRFGETFRTANPITLLTGLPNNVLCYGAKTLDARGPNSNYTTLETSSHMAIIGATRAIKLGRLDCAVTGGYSAHNDKVFTSALTRRRLSDGTPIAEGAAFIVLERRAIAEKRSARIIGKILSSGAASEAVGPYGKLETSSVCSDLIAETLQKAEQSPSDVEVVMTTGSQISDVDRVEYASIKQVWNSHQRPIVLTTASRWGHLMEAGGIAEIGFLHHIFCTGQIPETARYDHTGDNRSLNTFNPSRTVGVILRASPYGEYSCLVVKLEVP
jgi:3-oxoacyl-(acyl-carrier-protein) synthase